MSEFDPEFDSGCSSCDTEHPMSDMYYDPATGEHTCHQAESFDKAMDILKVENPIIQC